MSCPAETRAGLRLPVMASKLLRAVVLGPPGSGKGTVCERIARSFGLQHLSSGQFLRENLRGGGGECPGAAPSRGTAGTAGGGLQPQASSTGRRWGWDGEPPLGAPQVVLFPWVYLSPSLQPGLTELPGKSGSNATMCLVVSSQCQVGTVQITRLLGHRWLKAASTGAGRVLLITSSFFRWLYRNGVKTAKQ